MVEICSPPQMNACKIVMKPFSLFLMSFMFLSAIHIQAQTYCNNNLGSINPGSGWQTVSAPQHGYYTFTATIGCTYTFTFCNNGGSYSGDPYLTLSSAPTSGAYAANDDYCGLGSEITWMASSSGTVYLNVGTCCSSQCGSFSGVRTVAFRATCPPPAAPPAPVPAANPSCGPTSLNIMNPPAGITYYWQGTNSNGTSTASPTSSPYPVTTTGTYYVRAQNNTTLVWSTTSSSVLVTVNPAVSPPPAPTAIQNPACGQTNLNPIGGAPSNVTYYWQGTNANGTSTANPTSLPYNVTASGRYYVRANHTGGCWSLPDSIDITIIPLPAAPNVAANNPACIGQTLSLSATGTGTSYTWNGPNGFVSSDSVAVANNVNAFNAGVYSVYAIAQGCTATVAATINITVNTPPASPVPSTNAPVCQNGTLNLFASMVAGATYYWQGPGGFIANTQNTTISPVLLTHAGMFSVQTITNGCSSAVVTQNVTVNPTPAAPVLNSNTPVCSGGVLNLSANGPTGSVYSWSGPGGFVANTQNPAIPNVTMGATGIYSATAVVAACTSAVATLPVNVTASPAPLTPSSNSPICEGQSLNLSSTSAGMGTYFWQGPNAFTSALQDPVVNPAFSSAAGTYTVYAVENGCQSAGTTVSVQIQPAPFISSVGSNSPVCSGNNLSLTSATVGGATYEWNGPNGYTAFAQNTSIPNVTPAESGIYIVYATASGCTSLGDSIFVQVNPAPPVPVAGVNSPVCTGDIVNFTSSDAGSGMYSWTGPNGFVSSDQFPFIGSASLTDNGVYNLRIIENGCTSAVASVNLIVYSTPPVPAATSNSPVCGTQALNLMVSTIPNALYTWTGPDGFMAYTQNPVIPNMTQLQAGQYSVEVSVNGCVSNQDTLTVAVIDVPLGVTAFSNSPICVGDNLTLSMTGLPQGQFVWAGPNGFNSTQANVTLSPAFLPKAGMYYVMYNSTICAVSLASIQVVINPLPTQPVVSMVNGFLTSSQVSNIQWNYNNIPIPGATLPSLNPSGNGYYTVTYMDPYTGCESTSQAYLHMSHFVGTDQDPALGEILIMYPNPTEGNLNLKVDLPFVQEDALLEIRDVLGKIVYTEKIPVLQKMEKHLDLHTYGKGVYFLSISGSNMMIRARVIRQ